MEKNLQINSNQNSQDLLYNSMFTNGDICFNGSSILYKRQISAKSCGSWAKHWQSKDFVQIWLDRKNNSCTCFYDKHIMASYILIPALGTWSSW